MRTPRCPGQPPCVAAPTARVLLRLGEREASEDQFALAESRLRDFGQCDETLSRVIRKRAALAA